MDARIVPGGGGASVPRATAASALEWWRDPCLWRWRPTREGACADGGLARGCAFTHAQTDIGDRTAVAAALIEHRPSLVVNAAAYTNVNRAETERSAALQANAHGPAVLASACAGAEVPLLHISTDYVFDGTKARAYLESDPINPISAYRHTRTARRSAKPRCDGRSRDMSFCARHGYTASLGTIFSRRWCGWRRSARSCG